MPRPVVPIRRLPRNRSATLSRARWCGMIRCASEEMTRREVSTPRSSRPASSPISTSGSMTTPLPMTGVQPGVRIPDGMQVQRELLAVRRDHRVPGVVAALVADDVVHRPPSRSVALPLPSSPHWAPISTIAGIGSWFSSWIGTRAVPGCRGRWGGPDGRVSAWRPSSWTSAVWTRGGPPGRGRRRRPRAPTRSSSAGRCTALAAVLAVLLKAGRTAQVPVAWEPAGDKTRPAWRATWASAPGSPGT